MGLGYQFGPFAAKDAAGLLRPRQGRPQSAVDVIRCCRDNYGMTQILSLISHQFVVQASDRRVTMVPSGRIAEDDHNKAIFQCGHMVWAFTGVARIGATRTAEWMSDTVAQCSSLQQSIERLRAGASSKLHAYPPSIRRLAFVGVGFASEMLIDQQWNAVDTYPILTVISNFLDDQGRWGTFGGDNLSAQSWSIPKRRRFLLFESGVPLRAVRRKQLIRELDRAFAHRAGPPAIARLLARAIRSEHAIDPEGPIGDNIMCTVVSRYAEAGVPDYSGGLWPLNDDAGESDYFRLSTNDPAHRYYFYWPSNPKLRMHFGPDSVCLGKQIRDMKMQPVGTRDERRWTFSAQIRNRGMGASGF